MRRKAFWGEQGLTKRPISGVNNGELLDMEISMFGIRFYDRVKSQASRWLPWAELHRLAQQKALEQLGAAVAERSERSANTKTAKELRMHVCKEHQDNGNSACLSCSMAIDWNVMGKFCECGEKATGYRVLRPNAPVEFFCDDHFKPMPSVLETLAERSEPRILPVEENK